MKKKPLYAGRLFSLFLLLVTGLVFTRPEMAAAQPQQPLRVIIFPFHVNAATHLEYIQDGLLDMLSSRLTFKDEVMVVDRTTIKRALQDSSLQSGSTPSDQHLVKQTASRLNADYALWGSITEFGESLSIDATMIDISGQKPPVSFSGQSPDMDGAIPAINQLAAQINHKIFGRKTIIEEESPQKGTRPLFDIHTHPEKLIEQGFIN